VSHTVRQGHRLAGAGARNDQQRPGHEAAAAVDAFAAGHGAALGFVEVIEQDGGRHAGDYSRGKTGSSG